MNRFWIAIIILMGGGLPVLAETPVPETVDFNRDVRPILSENCYFCHGPDKNKRKADLRLDTRDGLFKAVKDHPAVIAGDVEHSALFQRVVDSDPDRRMPDPKSNKKLADRQIAILRKWIEQGAAWKDHWAYLAPVRPAIPAEANPIDYLVNQAIKANGLKTSAPADRVTLIRRLSIDLTGLQPTPDEVAHFRDDTSPDAYARLVTRLISSPHYGERMAVWWLDLVRYADSIGYHSDNPMNVWPYRDYVIAAFNHDKPFDQFTREQLAGDLLPNPTQESRIASCYNRLIETTEEGGAQPKEYLVKYECDRVRNISTVWMAATMGCSQCHDHKFDPYSQKDFYSMAAFFADVQEAPVGRREPGMAILNPSQEAKFAELTNQEKSLEKTLNTSTPELAAAQRVWERNQSTADTTNWTVLAPTEANSTSGTQIRVDIDDSIVGSTFPEKDAYVIRATTSLHGITGIRLEALTDPSLPAGGPGAAPNGNFVLTGVHLEAGGKPIKLARAFADHSQNEFAIAGLVETKPKPWAILPETGKDHTAIFQPAAPFAESDQTELTIRLEFRSQFARHEIGRFRLSVTSDANPASVISTPADVRRIVQIDPSKRIQKDSSTLATYYRSIAPALDPVREQLAAVRKSSEAITAAAPRCLVSTSGPPRTVKLLHRGEWLDDTGPVELPAPPHFLASSNIEATRLTRLDLANWLVSRENPLTARVVVNRLWKLYFGIGISKTLDDLGSQGESPVNPDLLDWLAVEFMDSGWDVKHIIRLIVTSNAYQRSSQSTPADREADPFNRFASHQSRYRLDAEMIRDEALQASGLLSTAMGGAPVKPYQPAGFWDPLNFPPRKWEADHGADQYRRGVYTWWQRTFPHPSLTAFDASSREESSCERLRSNIPQQALVLLNDPTYVEAARSLAARVLRQPGDRNARIAWAFNQVLDRSPTASETQIVGDLYDKHLAEYKSDASDAKALISIGQAPVPGDLDASELAAWTSVSRVILNLSEAITRS